MNKVLKRIRRTWLYVFSAPVILGITIIAMLWAGVLVKYWHDAEADYHDELRNGRNLALLFEENVLRSLAEADKAILYLRRQIEARLGRVDFHQLVSSSDIISKLIVQVAIVDANGIMRASNAGPQPAQPIDLSDREHFRFHLRKTGDELFVSKPMIGRASGKWSVQLTRKFLDKDRAFAGVVVASLDPEHFTEFYGSIDLGPGGSVSLIGSDGIVRASGGTGGKGRFDLGQDLSATMLGQKIGQERAGSFIEPVTGQQGDRLVTFRTVRGQPLAVTLSVPTAQIYAPSISDLKRNAAIAFCLSLVVVGVVMRSLRDQIRLRRAQGRLLRSQRRAQRTSERLRLTLDNISQGIILVTGDGRLAVINRQFVNLLELPEHLLIGSRRFDEVVQHQVERGDFNLSKLPSGVTPLQFYTRRDETGEIATYERTRPNGTVLEVRTTALPDGGFVRTFTDVTARRHAQSEVDRLATEDALTGLPNRRLFQQSLVRYARPQAGGRADGDRPVRGFALLYLDLDRFKEVNDTLGHPVGDCLLQAVALRIKQSLRADDLAARLGGDEFAVILPTEGSAEEPALIAQRLMKSLAQPFAIGGHQINIGVSVGIARYPQDAQDPDLLLKASDVALYAAKAAGRGAWRLYDAGMAEEIAAKRSTEIELRQAIAEGQLVLHYQPLYDLGAEKIVGFEAVTRWKHPERGMIQPGEFIALAEETGLIVQLGEWALRAACRQATTWPTDCRIAVNVSSIQFKSSDLLATIRSILAETGLAAHRLELEITESALLQDTEAILRTLADLRRLGIRISLDDFGTGYSSLSYLRTIPLTGIKIDRSFIKDLTSTAEARVIIKSISEIAAALGMSTTAEGIETEAQLASVRALGCREAQGFLLGKPAPANEIAELLQNWPVRRPWAMQRSHFKYITRDGEHTVGASRVAPDDRVRAIPG